MSTTSAHIATLPSSSPMASPTPPRPTPSPPPPSSSTSVIDIAAATTSTASMTKTSLPTTSVLARQLFLLHAAIRSYIDRIVTDAHALTPLAPDALLDHLIRRTTHVVDIVSAHCAVEDDTILPLLRSAIASASPASSQSAPSSKSASPSFANDAITVTDAPSPLERQQQQQKQKQRDIPALHDSAKPPPAKRPRTASPVSVDLREVQDDHSVVHRAFESLLSAVAHLRSAPLSRDEAPHPLCTPPPHHPSPHGKYTLSTTPPPSLSRPSAPHVSPMAIPPDSPTLRNAPTSLSLLDLRRNRLAGVRKAATNLVHIIGSHFNREEASLVPMCARLLSPQQHASLLIRVFQTVVNHRCLVVTFRLVSVDNLADLFRSLVAYADRADVVRIAARIAEVLPARTWEVLCGRVTALQKMPLEIQNPLVAILHMHKAMTRELLDIVEYCRSLDPSHAKQMQTLAAKFRFLRRVHSFHLAGEDHVLIKRLRARMRQASVSVCADVYEESHEDEDAVFAIFFTKYEELSQRALLVGNDENFIQRTKADIVACVRNIANKLIEHMSDEEKRLFPLVRKYFNVEEQEEMMREVMALVPAELVGDIIPWVFNWLDVDEQESMLRNLLRSTSRGDIRQVLESIARSVKKGMTGREEWSEICLRIPEIEEEYESIANEDEEDAGPVSEILRVHKALRIELNTLVRRAKEIIADGTVPDPKALLALAQGVAFLQRQVEDHSKAEDEVILPRLEKRAPGTANVYQTEHCDERTLFQDLARCLRELQCATEEADLIRLCQRMYALTLTLRDEMVMHLDNEEKNMWPMLRNHFTVEEQSEIVALVFGHMPGYRLRELLPWMIRVLSESERSTMVNHILQVTQSTMFEKWLKTWLPLGELGDLDDTEGVDEPDEDIRETSVAKPVLDVQRRGEFAAAAFVECRDGFSKNPVPTGAGNISSSDGGSCAARAVVSRPQAIFERTIRAIAQDTSLSMEERTRMMQQVMLAPYSSSRWQDKGGVVIGTGGKNGNGDDRAATYQTGRDGVKRLGCQHYQRACKVRAECCGKLYTCRLCHDELEQTHIMDRFATKELLCMRCDTMQPVSSRCVNPECGQAFARYFCEVCKFYDDMEGRKIYHCHSCNVCRAGEGLGHDYFHCMKCNQCMSIRYRNGGHKCVEKAMESDCPVCFQYLFTSTQPIKYLSCGHLMHRACHEQYVQRCVRCPVCSRSLEEMKPVFERIDELVGANGQLAMPVEYRTARCDLVCLDCHKQTRNSSYHFIYNKCPECSSYNTRVENIDPNGGDRTAASTTPSASGGAVRGEGRGHAWSEIADTAEGGGDGGMLLSTDSSADGESAFARDRR